MFDKNIWFLKEIIENINSKALGGVLPTFKMVFKLRYGTINFLFDYCDMFLESIYIFWNPPPQNCSKMSRPIPKQDQLYLEPV